MEEAIYDITGKKKGSVTLEEGIFGLPWNADLVTQVVNSLTSSQRNPVAHTKNRGEVRGGGKKPWKQKGTGRARHGSIRSPIWVGGGVAHGPRNEKNYDRKVSKKMRAKALYTILSRKLKDREILFVDSLATSKPKTSEAVIALKNLSSVKGFEHMFKKRDNAAVLALSTKNKDTERSYRNFSNIEVIEARNLSPLTVLEYKYLVIENPAESLNVLPGKSLFTKKETTEAVEKPRAKKTEPKVRKKAVKPAKKAAK